MCFCYSYSSITYKLRKASEALYTDPEEEIERKILITTVLRKKTGDQLRRMMEEEKNPALPYK